MYQSSMDSLFNCKHTICRSFYSGFPMVFHFFPMFTIGCPQGTVPRSPWRPSFCRAAGSRSSLYGAAAGWRRWRLWWYPVTGWKTRWRKARLGGWWGYYGDRFWIIFGFWCRWHMSKDIKVWHICVVCYGVVWDVVSCYVLDSRSYPILCSVMFRISM